MSLELAIKDHAAALLELAAAIRAAGAGVQTTNTITVGPAPESKPEPKAKPAEKPATKPADDDGDGEEEPTIIYWVDNKGGTFGKVESQADYDKLKKKNANITKTTETGYAKKVKEAEAKAAAASKSSSKPKASDGDAPSKEELAKAFQAYLPKDLDDDEKTTRRAFVSALLERFGGAKITEMPEEHWALAINLVTRKLAGQDIDPEDAEFEAVEEDEMI